MNAYSWFERRGCDIYTEDKGPGTAKKVASCATAQDAEILVKELQDGCTKIRELKKRYSAAELAAALAKATGSAA